ncbi:hypothetical protein [Zobellia barbeyronii]|uniref:Uncharacterized protein n=1 Tax=Zobellia barbeyronii TaxID=2748009 RepID=A0ABS5WDI9_9FLAO|nr:hypothetical protein [Zobellia barbeyronii]MBT2161464.1 hypothetical protein [Zobellia barbeyronii]
MFRYFHYFILFIILVGCSNDDSNSPKVVPEEIENPIIEPEIGLARFGTNGINDRGVKLFDTDKGFVSFEYEDYLVGPGINQGKWVIRRLDDKLKIIDSKVLENIPFIQIQDIHKLDSDVYAVIGNNIGNDVETNKKATVILVNEMGDEINSIIVSDFLTEGGSSNTTIIDSKWVNNKLYLSLGGTSTRIIAAFGPALSLIWEKFYSLSSARVFITLDANSIYIAGAESISGENFNVIFIEQLDVVTGEKLDGWAFTQVEMDVNGLSSLNKLLNDDGSVYLMFESLFVVGGTENFSRMGIKILNKATGELTESTIPDLAYGYDFELLNDGFLFSGYAKNDERQIIRTDKMFDTKWSYTVQDASFINDVGISADGDFLFSGYYGKGIDGNADLFQDVLLGILTSEGTLK